MAGFRAVIIEHGYKTSRYETEIITAAGGELIDMSGSPLEDALRLAENCEAIMLRRLVVDAGLIRRFKRCRILARYGVGTDNVDVDAATTANIIVGHSPLYATDEVSVHAAALLLACVRDVVPTHKRLEEGAWNVDRPFRIRRVAGRTLGIVGFGNIGRAVARKFSPWDLRIVASDPYVEPERAARMSVELVRLETLLGMSDLISLHCPLLPETRHLIDSRALDRVKPGAILVNTARGAVLDTSALLSALDSGRLAAAGLDVFAEEPLPPDSPLRLHPRVVLTDHTAWYSEESQVELQTSIAREVVRVCTGGLPVSLMNPEVLRRLGRFEEWTPPDNILWQLKRNRVERSRGV